jgi:hypothetical protein
LIIAIFKFVVARSRSIPIPLADTDAVQRRAAVFRGQIAGNRGEGLLPAIGWGKVFVENFYRVGLMKAKMDKDG